MNRMKLRGMSLKDLTVDIEDKNYSYGRVAEKAFEL